MYSVYRNAPNPGNRRDHDDERYRYLTGPHARLFDRAIVRIKVTRSSESFLARKEGTIAWLSGEPEEIRAVLAHLVVKPCAGGECSDRRQRLRGRRGRCAE